MGSMPGLPHPFPRPIRPDAVTLVSPLELRDRLGAGEPTRLLDVRVAAERTASHLPDDLWVPLAELPARWRELPRDKPIVVYDQFGSDARRAAVLLQRLGVAEVAALEGGVDEYARVVDPSVPRYAPAPDTGEFLLRQIPRRETGCLSYFVGDPRARVGVLIDPGHDVEPYLDLLRTGDWRLAAILETHTHADHRAGHAALHARTDAPILVGRLSPALYPHRSLEEGESVEFGGERLDILETPGHTRDHVSVRVRDKVFTGDTLLVGSCGRTDLGDGSPDRLWESLHDKLLRLPAETEVLPAHFGPHHALIDRFSSTIGYERATNEALLQPDRAAFLRYMTEGWPPKPAEFDRIVAENLATF
ncbi:MAG TPA: MBL fold metallo-hydrolase [Thermoplasmata archaeon]|nr:MBL fold metallo-hydrolase [Thermoplasmata archaeon]